MSARLGKEIAYVLRHAPQRLASGLTRDGWASLDELARALEVAPAVVREAVVEDATRFELDGERVRARHGHSVEVTLGHPRAVPPEVLFHGTVRGRLEAIGRHGLTRGRRQAVHLSSTREQAERVGARRGAPVVIEVRARAAHDAGVAFEKVGDGAVWLVPAVPAAYLSIPDGSTPTS